MYNRIKHHATVSVEHNHYRAECHNPLCPFQTQWSDRLILATLEAALHNAEHEDEGSDVPSTDER